MKKLNLLAIVLFISGACFAQNSGKVVLTKGSQYDIKETVKTHSVTEAMGQEMATDMDITSAYKLSVEDVAPGKNKVKSVITKVKMKMSMMGQEMEYDSDSPDDSNPMAGPLNSVINKDMKLTIDDQGKVIEKDGVMDEESEILSQVSSSGSGTQAAFLAVPTGVKVGDSFDINREDSSAGTKSTLKYTLKSLAGDVGTFSFTGKVATEKTMETQGMEVTTALDGTVEGETIVNVKTGIVQSTKSKAKTSGTVSVMGQEMPSMAEVTSEITVSKVN